MPEQTEFRVLKNDRGIRPTGPADACFYCGRKVGQCHDLSCCPMIVKTVVYNVLSFGKVVGVYTTEEPAHWTVYDGEFHNNESSQCLDNCVDEIAWCASKEASWLQEQLKKLADAGDCACGLFELKHEHTVAKLFRSKH